MDIVIVGAGKLGFRLAEILTSAAHNITVVDNNEDALDKVANRLDVLAVLGNGAQLEVLERLAPHKVDMVAAVTASDETNIVIALLAKKLGCPQVVARVRSPEYAAQIDFLKEKFAIDFIANPDLDLALDVARYVLRGYSNHMESFARGKVGLFDVPMAALPEWAGKKLYEIKGPQGILVAALSRGGQIMIPDGETCLATNDTLYLIGRRETVTSFAKNLPQLGERKTTRRIMLLGGGRAGFYLAHRLLLSGIAVKIIEQSPERCGFLAENLKGALIICGDGSDLELLQDEGLVEMDALVSLTGNDEENLMLALLAKRLGVGKVVAKVSRSNFVPIIEQLGIDRAVNPVLISAAEIVRFIQGGQFESLSLLFGGQAEVGEIIVPADAAIVGKSLQQAKMPQGLIVGTVVRGGEVIIPQGTTVIEAGDRVIIFCLQKELPALQRFFTAKRRGFWHEFWSGNQGAGKPPLT